METVREQLIKPFRSENNHFKFNFTFENSNRGKLDITFLKSKRTSSYDFAIDSTGSYEILRIQGILIKRAENDGFDGGINKAIDKAIDYLKYGISDLNA